MTQICIVHMTFNDMAVKYQLQILWLVIVLLLILFIQSTFESWLLISTFYTWLFSLNTRSQDALNKCILFSLKTRSQDALNKGIWHTCASFMTINVTIYRQGLVTHVLCSLSESTTLIRIVKWQLSHAGRVSITETNSSIETTRLTESLRF